MPLSDPPADEVTPDELELSAETPRAVVTSDRSVNCALLLTLPLVCLVLMVVAFPMRHERQPAAALPNQNAAGNASESRSESAKKTAEAGTRTKSKSKKQSNQTAKGEVLNSQPRRKPLTPAEIAQLRIPGPSEAPKPKSSPPPPWESVFSMPAKEVPGFHEVCFRLPDARKDPGVSREQFRRWFRPVKGQKYRVYSANSSSKTKTGMDGVLQWMAPWKQDTSLVLGVSQSKRFQIHLIDEDGKAVSFVHNGTGSQGWLAYRGGCPEGQVLADPLQLAGVVDPSIGDTSSLAVGLRYRQNSFVLHRGDLELMRVPFSGRPKETYFVGATIFHELSLQRTKDFPLVADSASVSNWQAKGSSLPWSFAKPSVGQLIPLPDDSVELQGIVGGVVRFKLPTPNLHEIRILLEDPSPGCGIAFGGQKGTYGDCVRFVANQNGGQRCAVLSRGVTASMSLGDPFDKSVPCMGRRVWLRMLPCVGRYRCWIGQDGKSWVELAGSGYRVPEFIKTLCISLPASGRVRIVRVESHPLKRLVSLAKPGTLKTAPSFADHGNLTSTWYARAAATQPSNVGWEEWRVVCALKALQDGCSESVARALLHSLLERVVNSQRSLAERLAILREGYLLMPPANRAQAKQRSAFFSAALRANGVLPVTNRSLVSMSGSTSVIGDEEAIQRTLLRRLYAGQWVETLELCEQLNFFTPQNRSRRSSRFVDWARYVALRRLPGSSGDSRISRRHPNWRHPYVEELNKETYNVLAELRAIVNTKSFEDAARMITTVAGENLSGVAPAGADRQHLLSLGAAIRQAVGEHSALRQLIESKYGSLAALRIRAAIKNGNERAVQLAAIQFEATPAAAEARQWLGDRALVLGRFAESLAQYRRATRTGSVALRRDVKTRIQLVSAMLGLATGKSLSSGITLGDVKLSMTEFQALLKRLQRRPLTQVLIEERQSVRPLRAEKHQPGRRVRWKWAVGIHPNRQITSGVNKFNVPWVIRQLAIVPHRNDVYISNRFHVARIDLSKGSVTWVSKTPPKHKPMYSRNWTLIPTRPVITGGSVIVRTLHGRGPLVRCLDRKTGKQIWIIEPTRDEQFASDPFRLLDDIAVFAVKPAGRTQQVLQLLRLDGESGEILQRTDVMRLRSSWSSRQVCQVTPTDDGALVTIGGAAFSIDAAGQLRWVRQQVVVPTDINSAWVQQSMQPPRIAGHLAILTSPGVRTLECVAAETGQLVWRRVFGDLRKCVGVAQDTVVVRLGDAYVGLNQSDGSRSWRLPIDATMSSDGEVCQGRYFVFSRRSMTNKKKQVVPQLVWFDLQKKVLVGSVKFPSLVGASPVLGPFFYGNGKWWGFYGKTMNQTDRELIELKAVPKSSLESVTTTRQRRRQDHAIGPIHQEMPPAFASWQVLDGVIAINSKNQFLVVNVKRKRPLATLGYQLRPGQRLKKLVLHADSIATDVSIRVMHAGRVLWSREPETNVLKGKKRKRRKRNRKVAAKPPEMVVIPLEGLTGGWLTINTSGLGQVIWKKIELQ